MDKAEKPQKEVYKHSNITPQDFGKDEYIDLWKYFEGRADMLKDRLWTMSTWLLGFNSLILGFIGTQLISIDPSGMKIRSSTLVFALVLTGCIICLYAFLLIKDYDKHIQRNWDRAGVLKKELPLVKQAWARKSSPMAQPKERQNARLQKPAKYLYGFALGYLLLFLSIAVFIIVSR